MFAALRKSRFLHLFLNKYKVDASPTTVSTKANHLIFAAKVALSFYASNSWIASLPAQGASEINEESWNAPCDINGEHHVLHDVEYRRPLPRPGGACGNCQGRIGCSKEEWCVKICLRRLTHSTLAKLLPPLAAPSAT